MNQLSDKQKEKARNLQKAIKSAVADKGRDYVSESFGFSSSQTSKFCSGDHPEDCKVNVNSLSEFIAGLGLELCPADNIPVHKSTIIWAWHTCWLTLGNAPILNKLRKQFEDFFGHSMDSFTHDD